MYYFLIIAFSVICLAVMPFFLVEQKNPSIRSLILKMICASMFLLVGVTAAKKTGANPYARFMLLGLLCAWFGDLFLHIQGKAKAACQVIGVLAFLSAHVMYLIAFGKELKLLSPQTKMFSVSAAIFVAAVLIVYTVIVFVTKTPMNPALIGLYVYAIFLTFMCFTALRLSAVVFPSCTPGAIMLGTGAILFVLSDGSLGILMFNKKLKTNFPLKIFNIGTYFVGQLMLAATILYIGG
ncbi:MAG: lysoplasmalogenase [Clostridia bacterium]|nr:lysoplasmalogenase [Clostridia bacterium]